MDESAQQAVNLAVNATIFIIALSITIQLMITVRDVATKAYEYDASLPTGSRVVAVDEEKRRTIKGYELISYYANYMTTTNNQEIYIPGNEDTKENKFYIIIENSEGQKLDSVNEKETLQEEEELAINFNDFFTKYNIDMNKTYEIITTNYNSENQFLTVTLKEID